MFSRSVCLTGLYVLILVIINSTEHYGRRCLTSTSLWPNCALLSTTINEQYQFMTSSGRFLFLVRSPVKSNQVFGPSKTVSGKMRICGESYPRPFVPKNGKSLWRTFVPRERKFLELSFLWPFVPGNFHSRGTKVPGNFRSRDLSFTGTFVPIFACAGL